jgi:hypothetical protein
LLALKLLATEQLSGQLPNIQTLVKGIKLRVPDIQQSGSNVPFEDVYWEGLGTNLAPLNNCTDPDNDANSTTGWTVSTGTGISEAGGETGFRYKLTSPVGGDGQVIQNNPMSLTEGKTYKFTFSAGADVGDSYRVWLWDSDASESHYFIWAQAGQGAGVWDNHVFYFTCGGTHSNYQLIFNSVNPNDVAYFDNFSFKEVKSVDFTTENWAKLSDWSDCTWDGTSYVTQYSSNPAYCLRDFLLNTRYGLGEFITTIDVDNTTIDTSAKKQWQMVDPTITLYEPGGGISEKLIWAVGNQEHRNEMHFVIEGPGDPANVFRQMARIGRMLVFYSNGYIKFKYEEDESSVQLFTMGNVVENSFNLSFMPHTQIPNILEVQFTDANDKYKMNTMEVVDETEWALGKPRRKKTLSLKGVTNTNQVLRETKFALNSAKYRRMAAEWKAPLQAVHCEPGDVVDFQHDVTQWGWGGKAIGGSSTTIQLDKDIPPEVVADPASYTIKVQHSNDTIETFLLSGTDTDYTLTIQGTFVTTPVEDAMYLIGQADTTIFPFRIMGISITDDEELQIQAIEHEADIYDDLGLQLDTKEYSELPNPSIIPNNVINLSLTELKNKLGFSIAFEAPSQTRSDGTDEDTDRTADYTWHRAEIYLSVDNVNFDRIATAYEAVNNVEYTDIVPNGRYYIRVYSASRYVSSSTYEEASIKIKGDGIPRPYPPSGLEIVGQGNNTTFVGHSVPFRWKPRHIYSGVGGIEIHDPAGGTDYWAYIRDFKIEIWEGDVLLRETYKPATDPTFNYSFQRNFEDHNGVGWVFEARPKTGTGYAPPAGTFTIKVWQRNAAGKLSAQPAQLTVTSDTPPKPTNLSTTAIEDGVTVIWDEATVTDFDYYRYRTKVGSGAWSSWETIYDNRITRLLTAIEQGEQGRNRSTIQTEVQIVDVFGTTSPTSSVSASCDNYKVEFTVSPTGGKGHFTTIASAIDALPSNGGVIKLAEGKHVLPSGGITLPSKDITVEGIGRDAVKVVNSLNATGFSLYSNSTENTYSFSNFTCSVRASFLSTPVRFFGCKGTETATNLRVNFYYDKIKGVCSTRAGNEEQIIYQFYNRGSTTVRDSEFVGGNTILELHSRKTTVKNNLWPGITQGYSCFTNLGFTPTNHDDVGVTITDNVITRLWGIGFYHIEGQGCILSNNRIVLNASVEDVVGNPTWGAYTTNPKAILLSNCGDAIVSDNTITFINASKTTRSDGGGDQHAGGVIYQSSLDRKRTRINGNTINIEIDGQIRCSGVQVFGESDWVVSDNNIRVVNASSNGSAYGITSQSSYRGVISDNNIEMGGRAADDGIWLNSVSAYISGVNNLVYNTGVVLDDDNSASNDVIASQVY